ncbi:MAG: hypothetical protein R3E89_05895 [Thiolinea sp.]
MNKPRNISWLLLLLLCCSLFISLWLWTSHSAEAAGLQASASRQQLEQYLKSMLLSHYGQVTAAADRTRYYTTSIDTSNTEEAGHTLSGLSLQELEWMKRTASKPIKTTCMPSPWMDWH